MPVSVSVSAAEWVRHVVFSGTVTDADVIAAYRVIGGCLLDPSMDVLVDASAVGKVAVTSEGLRTLADRCAQDAERLGAKPPRLAILAPRADVLGVARLRETLRASDNGSDGYFICRAMVEARRWLGLDEEPGVAA